jgi:PTH1 family peptidyl-tRNA hydrolase
MKLIVGLGNPGEKYQYTRHNLGFMVVEKFLKDFETADKSVWQDEPKFKSEISQIDWQPKVGRSQKVILAKPKTYMNNSGMSVQLLTSYFKVQPSDIWIIHDDVDIPLGMMKIRLGGSAAGHHGVESIIESLGTDKFWRFRLGIGIRAQRLEVSSQKLKNVEDLVLSGFKGNEKGKVKDLIKHGSKAIQMGLEESIEAAQNRFNTK